MKFISIDDNIDEKDNVKVEDNSKITKPSDSTKIKNYCKNVSQSYNCDIENLSYENINTNKTINLISSEYKPYIEMYFQKFKDETTNLFRLSNLFIL